MPAQFNRSGQFAVLLVDGADRGGGFLGNNKHAQQDGYTPGPGQVGEQGAGPDARVSGLEF
jgi:hypothetical protein